MTYKYSALYARAVRDEHAPHPLVLKCSKEIDFELPYLREYLRDHGALNAQLQLSTKQVAAPRNTVVRRPKRP
jgi:hypothetical protein